jgi:hypothetical protein
MVQKRENDLLNIRRVFLKAVERAGTVGLR